MHKIVIPQSITDRVIARRGKAHAYEDIDPAKTALVVVDLQNGFMMPEIAHAACDMAVKIVPNVNRLAATVRRTGGKVVWIQTAFTEETLKSWSVHYEMARPGHAERRAASLGRDAKGYQLWSELDARPDDLYVEKLRFSAFIQGSSNLEAVLRAHGLDTLLITGTVTNVCCESTARDAMMLNFKTIMVTDGNAATTDDDHNGALIGFYLTFGDIQSTDQLIANLERGGSRKATAAAG
ncbi:MAG TPA: isochorismatase family cysteine hydrolase [Stellaceae bacterium]|nr:isochorismatase family cysteine hydrolase [Stellaceae bacterium]